MTYPISSGSVWRRGSEWGNFGARRVDFDEDERLLTMGRSVVRTSEGLIVREGKTERSQ